MRWDMKGLGAQHHRMVVMVEVGMETSVAVQVVVGLSISLVGNVQVSIGTCNTPVTHT